MNRMTAATAVLAISALCLAAPTQQARFTEGATPNESYFGQSVAIDGDTALVGSPKPYGEHGAVNIYTRTGSAWSLQQEFIGADDYRYEFGAAVAVAGDTAALGRFYGEGSSNLQGSVTVVMRTGTTWTFAQKLAAGHLDGQITDNFGASIALSGDSMLIGAPEEDGGFGAVYWFERTGTLWTKVQRFVPDVHNGYHFGNAVALSGDTAVVGCDRNGEEGLNAGSAYIFERTGGQWTQRKQLLPGAPLDVNGIYFGTSVSVSGDTVAVGAIQRMTQISDGTANGAVYVYRGSGTNWPLEQKLTGRGRSGLHSFGSSVALAGDRMVVGASTEGVVYAFERSDSTWTDVNRIFPADVSGLNRFGHSIALSDETMIVGAPFDNVIALAEGSAHVFTGMWDAGGGGGGGNAAPAFILPPIASANPVPAGRTVKFATLASDADKGNKVRYEWHFGGDAMANTKLKPAAKTVFDTPGSYEVFVRATDGKGGSVDSEKLTVVVVAPGTPYFDVAKVSVGLKFTKAGKDTIRVSGQFPLADGTPLEGRSLAFAFGEIVHAFQLDAKGRSGKGAISAKVTPPRSGVAKFTVTLTGSFAGLLSELGLTNETIKNVDAQTRITITFDGTPFAEDYVLVYGAKGGKTGAAK